jgi:hypothetical protein
MRPRPGAGWPGQPLQHWGNGPAGFAAAIAKSLVITSTRLIALGLICDQRIKLCIAKSLRDYPEHLRRVRFKDPTTGKTLVFLTNNTALPAIVIAQLYKSRWQVELFIKWIKQHLRIKKFLGNSENAVKTQIWCAIATYVLTAIVKKELQLKTSLYTCLQILSVSVFEKTQISCALRGDDYEVDPLPNANQLILFDF